MYSVVSPEVNFECFQFKEDYLAYILLFVVIPRGNIQDNGDDCTDNHGQTYFAEIHGHFVARY